MKIKMLQKYIRSQCGNVAIEMAAIAPVLIFMALGAYDFGMAYSVTTSYVAAIRAGYEYAFTSTDITAIGTRVTANLDTSTLDTGYPQITKTCECENNPETAVACTGYTCSGTVTTPYVYINIKLKGKYSTAFSWPFLTGNAIPISEEGRIQVQ